MDDDPREMGKFLDRDGKLNNEGERRTTNGILAAAPKMAKLKTLMDRTGRHDLDVAGHAIDALTAMDELKKVKIKLDDYLALGRRIERKGQTAQEVPGQTAAAEACRAVARGKAEELRRGFAAVPGSRGHSETRIENGRGKI